MNRFLLYSLFSERFHVGRARPDYSLYTQNTNKFRWMENANPDLRNGVELCYVTSLSIIEDAHRSLPFEGKSSTAVRVHLAVCMHLTLDASKQ